MKTLAFISAVLCITVVAAIAAPRTPTGIQTNRASITVPSRPADFQYGLSGNDWWAAQGRKVAR